MPPSRILMTADTVGGVWTYSLELARALRPHGVSVGLATMGAPLSPQQRLEADAVPDLAIFESAYKLEWMEEPWNDIAAAGDWLLGLERSFAPDIVHLNQYCCGAAPFRAPVLVVGHSCVLSWWRAVHGCAAPAEWLRYRVEVARGLAGASLVVAPTGAMLQSLQDDYGPLPRTAVIPNGRSRTGSPAGTKRPFIFSAGRFWDEAKNLAVLERAASELPWPTYVAGENRHPEGGARVVSNCRFLGRLDSREMERWLAEAAIYALPARYEPFGLSALEAALAGCALVLGDIPSLREVWGDAALFAPAGDPEALAGVLRRLIESESERREYAARALRRTGAFTPEEMAKRYLTAYADCEAAAHRGTPGVSGADPKPAGAGSRFG